MLHQGFIRYVLVPLGTAAALVAARPARGQFHIVPRERLDSMAQPALAHGAQAMRFDRTRIETGAIGEDDGPKSFVFTWRNTGDKPLVITRVKTTCGCAVPTCGKRPVKPGETDSVTVTYHPKGHPGRFVRKIFIFTQLAGNAAARQYLVVAFNVVLLPRCSSNAQLTLPSACSNG